MSSWNWKKAFALVGALVAVSSTIVTVVNLQMRQSVAFGLSKGNSLGEPVASSLPLASEVGTDYTQLQNLLKSRKWREADQETTRLMFKVALRNEKGWENWTDVWVSPENMAKFPCTDLRTIDRLWYESSNKRLGFRVQKRLFEEVGRSDWLKFQERLGWYSRNSSVSYDTLVSNPLEGSLPIVTREIDLSSLSQRLRVCNI